MTTSQLAMSPDDCQLVVVAMGAAIDMLPITARSVRSKLRTIASEHKRAAKWYGRAVDSGHKDPEIRAVGAIERGEWVLVGEGTAQVRRVTDTGVEVVVAGLSTWHNIAGRTTPYVVVDGPLEGESSR